MKINGETFKQWAKRAFEFEWCSECGHDESGHSATIVMGNWFAVCNIKLHFWIKTRIRNGLQVTSYQSKRFTSLVINVRTLSQWSN